MQPFARTISGFITINLFGKLAYYILLGDKISSVATYKNGKLFKHATIKTGYILIKTAGYLERRIRGERGSVKSDLLHQVLIEDFFGLSMDQLKSKGYYFVGWPFSYQATRRRVYQPSCDFKFKTINEDVIDQKLGLRTINHEPEQLQDWIIHFYKKPLSKV